MKKALFISSLFLLLAASQSNAQSESSPNALAFRWTGNNFQFPITQKFDRYDYTSGVELKYIRHLGKFLNLGIPLKVGKAFLPLDDQGNVRNAELIGSLDALLHLKFTKPESKVYPYLLAGAGVMSEIDNGWEMNPEFPVGAGLNFRVSPNLYLSFETQYRFDLNDNRNQLQHALGIWMVLGGKTEEKITDSDKDGVQDIDDKCPDEPGPAELMGCPDTDGDGIADEFDACPDEAGNPSLAGCPDRDGDGIADHLDLCPDEAGKKELSGCPDQDGDGVADKDDQCPTIAGLPSDMGCPDTDGDGVIDPIDRCPETAGPASNKGCPELKPEEKEVLEFAMKAVQFETGSAKLLASSNKTLDEIAQIMKNNLGQKLRISGHTDSIGEADENLKLSERRAKTCFDYLIANGVDAKRMSHAGYGESKPIGDNMFSPGREQNRRVEFEMYID
ncbi:MAG: OmpA family protein [Saprospiraceae bacterium]|nr:OmpA family protein [Saprospiraceae bacterium]MCF8249721.1 OmpA family protein [Saprospiraceae bacterium]MCF8282507.1 OmpA family protein [Bacteroidales bacterium]MCF8314092.1 OmpA family protein [Saprospiraceae bacterium]MCF8442837.1 OmpA family protein [Saprospiraceae bacterium]